MDVSFLQLLIGELAESHAVMSENLDLFVLEFGNKIRKLKESQLTAQLIWKIFNVFPDSIVLVASDGTIEVPDERGCFSDLHTYMDYEVQGDSCISRDYSSIVEGAVSLLSHPYKSSYNGTKRPIAKQASYKHKGPFTKPPGVISQEYEAVSSKTKKGEEWKKILRFVNTPQMAG